MAEAAPRFHVADKEESGKENALPHVKGLAVDRDLHDLNRKIKQFEEKIAAYSGRDPIAPRFEFISWLETHYPAKEKKQGLLFEELEKFCKLVDEEPFNSSLCKNDPRYVKIWLRYATLSGDSTRIYDFMKNRLIGVGCAQFYIEWALELERVGKYLMAQNAFKLGFDNLAEPRDDLQYAFEGFVSRRSACRSDEAEEVGDSERLALQKLRPVVRQRVMAPVDRTGRNVLGPAGVVTSHGVVGGSNARWDVQADDEENMPSGLGAEAGEPAVEEESALAFEEFLNVDENRVEKIAFGSKAKLPGRRVGPKVPISALKEKDAPFSIFCDDGEEPKSRVNPPRDPAEAGPIRATIRKTVADTEDARLHYVYTPCAVSIEERLAAAFKYSRLMKQPLHAARVQCMKLSAYEIGMWLWNTRPSLTQADLPPNSRLVVPSEVFQSKSLEEVLLEKRAQKGLVKVLKRKSPCADEELDEVVDSYSKESPYDEEVGKLVDDDSRTLSSDEKQLVYLDEPLLECFLENPFLEDLRNQLLAKMPAKATSTETVYTFNEHLPKIQLKAQFYAKNGDVYEVRKIVGEGAYAKVFRALVTRNMDRRSMDMDLTMIPMQKDVVFKVQSPPCPWELYICKELHARLQKSDAYSIRKSIVKVSKAYVFKDGSLLVSNFEAWGSLLCAVNHYGTLKRTMPECLVFCYAYDILQIVQRVHECGVIHADLKIDNFLISDVPSVNKSGSTEYEVFGVESRCLQLIDFGRAIDMSVLPPDARFSYVSGTKDFCIPEMREKRTWNYHIDYYGIAATVFVLLFGKHMEIEKYGGCWVPAGVHFRRPLQASFWKDFFETLLNLPTEGPLPSLADLRSDLFECFMESGKVGEISRYAGELKSLLNA